MATYRFMLEADEDEFDRRIGMKARTGEEAILCALFGGSVEASLLRQGKGSMDKYGKAVKS